MKFNSQALLEQTGWKPGMGLGKKEHGMTDAIKVSIKNDKTGIGHNASEQFTYHWWDHAFNKVAQNLQISTDKNFKKNNKVGKVREQIELSTHKKHTKSNTSLVNNKSLSKYANMFVKTSTLNDGILQKSTLSSDSDTDSENSDIGTASKLTDEELFKRCGGLTAHKGARHGLNLKGKLERITQQEQSQSRNYGNEAKVNREISNENIKENKHKDNKSNSLENINLEDSKCLMDDQNEINKKNKIDKKSKKKHQKRNLDVLETSPNSDNIDVSKIYENKEFKKIKYNKNEKIDKLQCCQKYELTSDTIQEIKCKKGNNCKKIKHINESSDL